MVLLMCCHHCVLARAILPTAGCCCSFCFVNSVEKMALVPSSTAAPAEFICFFRLKWGWGPQMFLLRMPGSAWGHLGTLCRDQDECSDPGWVRKHHMVVLWIRFLLLPLRISSLTVPPPRISCHLIALPNSSGGIWADWLLSGNLV